MPVDLIGDKPIYVQSSIPAQGPVGAFWFDTSTGNMYRCTSVGPVTYTSISGGGFPAMTPVPFDASDFTCSGGSTWTVEAGDVSVFEYSISGKLMYINLGILTSTIVGVPASLYVKIPGGKVPVSRSWCIGNYFSAGTIPYGATRVFAEASGNQIGVEAFAGWIAAANAVGVFFQLFIDIA